MTNVYTSVKKNYRSAEHLMLCTAKAYICSAFMNWAGYETLGGSPKNIVLPDKGSSKAEKKKFIHDNISKFVEEHVLVEFDVEKIWRERLNKERQAEQESINQASVCSLLPGNDSEWVF